MHKCTCEVFIVTDVQCHTWYLIIGHVIVQSCLLINFQSKPISLQSSWLSVEQPIRIDGVLCKHHRKFPINKKIIPMLTYPIPVTYVSCMFNFLNPFNESGCGLWNEISTMINHSMNVFCMTFWTCMCSTLTGEHNFLAIL